MTSFILTDTPLTGNRRIWIALASAILQSTQPATGPASSSISFVGVAFESGLSSTWRCCSGDGTNLACADIPGTRLAAGVEYTIVVDYGVAGTLTCSVNAGSGPVSVTKTTNLPATAVNLGVQNIVVPLDSLTKNQNIGRVVIEQN
jgi:hypothetical protein